MHRWIPALLLTLLCCVVLIILMTPVGLAALVQAISLWLTTPGTPKPFSGQGLGQLNATLQFIATLLALSVSLGVLYWVWQQIGPAAVEQQLGMHVLQLLMLHPLFLLLLL